jgi:hypothetical protein
MIKKLKFDFGFEFRISESDMLLRLLRNCYVMLLMIFDLIKFGVDIMSEMINPKESKKSADFLMGII